MIGWDNDGDRTFEVGRPNDVLWAQYQAAAAATGAQVRRTDIGRSDHVSCQDAGFPAAVTRCRYRSSPRVFDCSRSWW